MSNERGDVGAQAPGSSADAHVYRELIESAPDALIVVDRGGRIALVNGQTEHLFGYAREELIGQPVDVLVPNAQRALHAAHREAYTRAPTPRPMGSGPQQRAVRKDGGELPVEVSLSPVRSHPDQWVIATIRDLSERRRIETRLLESTITLESIGDAVISCDDEGRVRLLNRVAAALTGWSPEEAFGRALEEVVVLFDAVTGARITPADLMACVDRGEETPPLVLRARSGQERPVADSIARITDAAGGLHGAVLAFRDVTEARRAEQSLRRSERDLHEIVDKLPRGCSSLTGPSSRSRTLRSPKASATRQARWPACASTRWSRSRICRCSSGHRSSARTTWSRSDWSSSSCGSAGAGRPSP